MPFKDKEYCNDRFQFCLNYPADFTAGPEPANGDGLEFFSGDKKTTITASGSLYDEEFDSLERDYKFFSESYKVAYHVMKPNYLIISGTDKSGNIIYQKTVIKSINYFGENPNTKVFQSIRIKYPASQQAKYASYCSYIAKAL
jgi:hypothetical protein